MEGAMKTEETEPWHKPKNGSVFPAKKRSVKKMIWDQIHKGNSNSNTVSPPHPQSSRATSTIHPS